MKINKLSAILASLVAMTCTVGLAATAIARPTVGGGNQPNMGGNNPGGSVQPPSGGNTSFHCLPQGAGNFATVGQRPGGQPIPLIVWTPQGSSYFGGPYTPQNRCQIVSQKLNAAVMANGGRLQNLLLTNGPVNGQIVICALSVGQNACNGNNMLFTLKPENANRAGQILGQLLQISQVGSSAGVIYETGLDSTQTFVDLGAWEEATMGGSYNQPIDDSYEQPEPNDGGGVL
ncbi:COP23 domain-containing protein [Phormidium sp. CCY1219]|uniref:COP23 domain-containing protein n=1 Tax=Phormidium sp. CCY1219 TaxID=2886104 RepID=UPI002D1E7AB7|nr:COP23 domain-containing protein [Phormidium sp. CCY1219]MEB3831713.1 COP23 domain-containing protein [Phormidium sp. CCY1219]